MRTPRIYHSGGDILMDAVWYAPEVWDGMMGVWLDERHAAAKAGNVPAFVRAVDLSNQYSIAEQQRKQWFRCAGYPGNKI